MALPDSPGELVPGRQAGGAVREPPLQGTRHSDSAGALLRWRLVLGPAPGPGNSGEPPWGTAEAALAADQRLGSIDRALDFLYGDERTADLSASAPYVPTWLGDIRRYFPRDVVAFLEKDAIERRGLRQLLLEPETLENLEKDVGLVATILAFKQLMPDQTRQTARQVVSEIVAELRRRLENQTRQSLRGALRRDQHSPLKVARNLDVRRTVREGLRNYQPSLGRIVPERVYFHANQQRYHERQIVILVDQSGSMGESVVYASIIAAIFASLPALDTRLIFFDTAVADVSDQLSDPVEVLFGTKLGGGTDIARAVAYGASLVTRPDKSIFLLITDLFEGGDTAALLGHLAALKESQVKVLCLLALNDSGRASYNGDLARHVAALDIPTFAATPNRLVEAVEQALRT
jgi:Mg-chelatase subunit ChlD